jgi:ElaB/YqjD/DUF883 family membrane-anchored ribosome-binding protein
VVLLQFTKTEREELMSLRAKIEGQLQESRDRCSTLEEQLKTYQVETFSVRYIFVWVAAHADSTS